MSAFHGPQEARPGAVFRTGQHGRTTYANKGVMRAHRTALYHDAEDRNRLTEHTKRRSHREGRCGRGCSQHS